jgi:hypothetical protein
MSRGLLKIPVLPPLATAQDNKSLFHSDGFEAGDGDAGGAIGQHEISYAQAFQKVRLQRQANPVVTRSN